MINLTHSTAPFDSLCSLRAKGYFRAGYAGANIFVVMGYILEEIKVKLVKELKAIVAAERR